jgi:hypothetical protein
MPLVKLLNPAGTLTWSLVPSKLKRGRAPAVNVGPLTNVPCLPFPLRSGHVVPEPLYELVFPASRWSTKLLAVLSTGVAVNVLVGEGVSDAVRVEVAVGVSVPAATPMTRCWGDGVGVAVRVRVAVAVTIGATCWV